MLSLILIIAVAGFGIAVFVGAPYLPILNRDAQQLLDLAHLKPGQTIIDLGSGDGRLLRAAAKRGVRGVGYEINPWLVWVSRLVCWRYRNLVTIYLADYWRVKLPPSDTIYVFLLDRYMTKLDHKLTHELTRPTQVVSYVFEIPGRTPVRRNRNTCVYQYTPQTKLDIGAKSQ